MGFNSLLVDLGFGIVPKASKICELEDICTGIYDCPHSTPKLSSTGPYLARTQDIRNGYFDFENSVNVSENVYKGRIKRAEPKEGDLLFSREGTYFGDAAEVPGNMQVCLGQRMVLIRPNNNKVNTSYLRIWINSNTFQQYLLRFRDGTVAERLNLSVIRKLPVLLPPKKYQNYLERQVKTIEAKVAINQQTNQTLEQISQAIFKSWFVDFEPVKAKDHIRKLGGRSDQIETAAQAIISGAVNLEDILKGSNLVDIDGTIKPGLDEKLQSQTKEQQSNLAETAKLFPDKFVESELGMIPEGWKCINVKDILKRLKPPKRYTKKQVQPYGKVPVFEQGAGLLLGFHNDPPGFESTLNNPIFIFGDHTCVIHLSIRPFDISQNVIPIRGKTLSTIWVYYAVKDLQKFQEYRRHWAELIVKKVIVPPKPLCKLFEKNVTTNHLKMEQNNAQNMELERIRDTLLPKLLSGELQVSE